MGNGHTPKSSRLKKIVKAVNPLDPKKVAVDLFTAGGRPTAGASLPGIGPSIQANSDEAMADELRARLPKDWDVGTFHDYLKHVRDAQKQGLDGDEAIERGKETFLDKVKYQKSPRSPEPRPPTHPFPQPLPPKPGTSPTQPNRESDRKTAPTVPASPGTAPKPFPVPLPPKPATSPQPDKLSEAPADPRVASLVGMAGAPIANPGKSALLKPVEKLTQPEMMDMIHSAQGDYRGWRSGDPLKAHTYERVQDWHVNIYGDGPQRHDGGKPIEPMPIRPIPEQPSPHTTPQGEDLWRAAGRLGQKVADAAGTDGYDNAVKGLQRGLNLLNQHNPLPARSPAYGPYTGLGTVAEDGKYGPQTDFALKHATARLGVPKVEEGLALGRFNTFARNAQKSGKAEGLDTATHGAFGPLFRTGDGPRVEAGVLQETLNQLGAQHDADWQKLKVDDWIGPKTTEAFGRVLKHQDADSLTQAFGRGLGLL